jgi:hypothetical protein
MKETVTPENHCPYCGKKFNRCTSVEDDTSPKPGDYTLCIRCSCVMVLDKDLTVRAMTLKEAETLRGRLLELADRTARAIRIVNARMPQN